MCLNKLFYPAFLMIIGQPSALSYVVIVKLYIIVHETGKLNDLELLRFALHIFGVANHDENRIQKILFLVVGFNLGYLCIFSQKIDLPKGVRMG